MTVRNHIIASHVIDASKPITSRTGVDRATKATMTLATAAALLDANGLTVGAASVTELSLRLNRRIADYYRNRGSITE